jgi:zinc protease
MMMRLSMNFSRTGWRNAILSLFVLATFAGFGEARATEIQRVVSPKGIEAWLVQENSVPLIAMSFAFVGGTAQDPVGKPGVANMLSGLLDEGAGDLDSQAFQTAIDDASIELSFDAGRDAFTGSLRTLVANKDEAARLLNLALTRPRFDPEPVERIRAQITAGIRSNEKDPDSVASDALIKAAFPDHPYGRPTEGAIETVAAITTDDLKAFHRKNIARDNLKIAVVGAIDPAALGKFLDDVFGGLPEKAELVPVPETHVAAPARADIDMSIPQTVISIAGEGMKRADPDFIAASIASYILGGGSGSRLYEEVREKRGLAYSVSLGLSAYDHAGTVFAGTSTRSDQADAVLALIADEIRKFAKDGPTEAELAKAKSYLIGAYPIRFTTSASIANQVLGLQMDNLGIDYPQKRTAMFNAVTIDDVKRVARRLFDADRLVVVRVGQPAT